MRMFDDFWLAHVKHSLFDTNLEDDFEEGDEWDDPFDDPEGGYGYLDDAFNYMEHDDEDIEELFGMDEASDAAMAPEGAEWFDEGELGLTSVGA